MSKGAMANWIMMEVDTGTGLWNDGYYAAAVPTGVCCSERKGEWWS